ncbi:AMP-binding protein [Burkholderia pseudomallei]|uniref:AMP-binding protein n=1 Tax=Burkholderia pseudomallei TaxID=28450 RepID=UPI001AD724E7|nr:AMP-binding protein [Burkholderia pseudomallei]MBO7783122.1 AMP-binding protein [Burkholderia pseudomallei]
MRDSSPLIERLLAPLAEGRNCRAHGVGTLDESGIERVLSYRQLSEAGLRMSAALNALGARAGDLALVALPATGDYLALLVGCVLSGVVPCTVPPPLKRASGSGPQVLEVACRLYRPRFVFTASAHVAELEAQLRDTGARVIDVGILHAASTGAEPRLALRGAGDTHHIQLTSGSTSHPKAAVISHRNVAANIAGIANACGYSKHAADNTVIWLPLHHDMGLVSLLLHLYYRTSLRLMPSMSFVRNPLGWLRRIAHARSTIAVAPTFALRYCVRRFNAATMDGADFSHLRTFLVGAERVDRATLSDFASTFAPYGFHASALQPCYGMAEATLAVTLHRSFDTPNAPAFTHVIADRIDTATLARHRRAAPAPDGHTGATDTLLAVGAPLDDMAYEIRDAQGRLAAEREAGEIFIRGASVMQGYLPSAGAPAPQPFDAHGWFATGDIGYVSGGQLFILGRKKEIIIIRGTNYFPHEIEETIDSHPAVYKGACIAVGIHDETQGTENLVVLVEAHANHVSRDSRAELQARMQQRLGYCAQRIAFVEPGALPRTTSGKPQRLKARAMFVSGELREIAPPPSRRADADRVAPYP